MDIEEEGAQTKHEMQITLTHGNSNNKTAQQENERKRGRERERALSPLYSKGLRSRRPKEKDGKAETDRDGDTMLCYTCCYCSLFPVLSDTCVISTGAKKAKDDTSHKALRKTKGKAWKIHPPQPKTKP